MSDFLVDIREFIARELQANEIDPQKAQMISANVEITFRRNYGGAPIYIKKSENHGDRNAEIYKAFNGRNMRHLCQTYDLCYQQVYKIIKLERKKRQGDLFA
jgi:Mor family transcriptional regulator